MGKSQKIDGNLALDQKKVIVIEATKRPEEQKLRVAAYCRVSSDSSDQMNSFTAQLNYYTALISGKENWTMVDLYADAGISGTSAKKRPDFQRLLYGGDSAGGAWKTPQVLLHFSPASVKLSGIPKNTSQRMRRVTPWEKSPSLPVSFCAGPWRRRSGACSRRQRR